MVGSLRASPADSQHHGDILPSTMPGKGYINNCNKSPSRKQFTSARVQHEVFVTLWSGTAKEHIQSTLNLMKQRSQSKHENLRRCLAVCGSCPHLVLCSSDSRCASATKQPRKEYPEQSFFLLDFPQAGKTLPKKRKHLLRIHCSRLVPLEIFNRRKPCQESRRGEQHRNVSLDNACVTNSNARQLAKCESIMKWTMWPAAASPLQNPI